MPTSDPLTPLTVESLQREIERTRAQLAASALALREQVAQRLEWRQWVRRRPVLFVGAAFLLGWALGARSND